MKVTIVGTGYVGLVTGACLAELGNDVLCLDVDRTKIELLNSGCVPIHEPGLVDIITRNREAGRLRFSTDIAHAVEHGVIQFIAVGTPPDEDGSEAARNIGRRMKGFKVIVDKSTVPVGTADKVSKAITGELVARNTDVPFAVISNPEFLKEGAAVEDFMRPDRIVIGCDTDVDGLRAKSLVEQLYAPFNRNHQRTLFMDVRSAEFAKYAANAMLATRISFMNELANLADRVGADIESVRQGIGSDPRIGYSFLYAGCGYGGSCFPKDVRALVRTAAEYDVELNILTSTERVNERQKAVLFKKIKRHFNGNLANRHFAVWGLSFKPNTDDMREATSRQLIADLLRAGASVSVYDPVALDAARRCLEADLDAHAYARIQFVAERNHALKAADALVIVTEWKEFRSPDFEEMKAILNDMLVFDGRNLYDPRVMKDAGWTYYTVGRDFAHVAT
ncbi:UDP-glucose dehydrogenase family protein [Paraburkholderia terrae]|uniref:UDP-glucose 6-dehydrogenase n=1 Tax=Paraburkholderia terrae TaxID=311230 RepID=A0A2I8ERK3_9BURK|nr:UDP-glucose/GDP-mannose dehydrogenase family protein [Paraburkholderia terrae]AUT62227.1 UDP-glucose/GDP-mannose dehydrogenase family protein [Paraburkholderia terrae]